MIMGAAILKILRAEIYIYSPIVQYFYSVFLQITALEHICIWLWNV